MQEEKKSRFSVLVVNSALLTRPGVVDTNYVLLFHAELAGDSERTE